MLYLSLIHTATDMKSNEACAESSPEHTFLGGREKEAISPKESRSGRHLRYALSPSLLSPALLLKAPAANVRRCDMARVNGSRS